MQNSKLADKKFVLNRVREYLDEIGEPKFRQKQITQAVFGNKIVKFEEMTTLAKGLRGKLIEKFGESVLPLKLIQSIKGDKTEKFLFELVDGNRIEVVEMEYQGKDKKAWNSLCISTQVGCGMGCKFCATGRIGFKRNLTVDEITGQLLWALANKREIRTVSLMGMGEPLVNLGIYEALTILINPEYFGIGQRKINVSTVGIVPGLKELIRRFNQINISLSLHAPNQKLRDEIMPVAKVYSIKQIFEVLDKHVLENKRKVFLAYLLLRGVNDSLSDAKELTKLIKDRGEAANLYHVNLIKYHAIRQKSEQLGGRVKDGEFKSDNFERTSFFKTVLEKEGISVTVRKSFGENIEAACGQLYAKYKV